MSRPAKPTDLLRRQGTFRKDRHSGRGDEAVVGSGFPQKPGWLSDAGSRLWDRIVEAYPSGAISELDEPRLVGLCGWYDAYLTYAEQLRQRTGNEYRTLLMAQLSWRQFAGEATKFGLSPGDRAALKIDSLDKQMSENEILFYGS